MEQEYIKTLEQGLINALDELSMLYKELNKEDMFDYYDKLRELTNMGDHDALQFLDLFSDNEEVE